MPTVFPNPIFLSLNWRLCSFLNVPVLSYVCVDSLEVQVPFIFGFFELLAGRISFLFVFPIFLFLFFLKLISKTLVLGQTI